MGSIALVVVGAVAATCSLQRAQMVYGKHGGALCFVSGVGLREGDLAMVTATTGFAVVRIERSMGDMAAGRQLVFIGSLENWSSAVVVPLGAWTDRP